MKWFLVIIVAAAVFFYSRTDEVKNNGGGNGQTSEAFAQIIKSDLVDSNGESVSIDTSKKYLVLYHGASW